MFDWHLAGEKFFSGVAVDVRAEEDASREGFATVRAHVREGCSSPVL